MVKPGGKSSFPPGNNYSQSAAFSRRADAAIGQLAGGRATEPFSTWLDVMFAEEVPWASRYGRRFLALSDTYRTPDRIANASMASSSRSIANCAGRSRYGRQDLYWSPKAFILLAE